MRQPPASESRDPFSRARIATLVLLVVLYVPIGAVHLWRADLLLPIVPDWVPFPRQVIVATGLCEMAGALGLLVSRTRRLAAVMLALYAMCVVPANIKHAIEGIVLPPIPSSWWYHAPRLALQPLIAWMPLFASGVITWPLGSRNRVP